MKRKYSLLLLPFLFFFFLQNLFCQITSGGTPPSFFGNSIISNSSIKKVLSPHANIALKSMYINPIQSKNDPLTFAYPQYVQYSIDTDGEWLVASSGQKYWTMSIKSSGALSLNLLFDKFVLPKTGRFFVFSADKSYMLGAFTYINNRRDSLFAISPIPGDEIVLEYSQGADELQKPIISISQVNHDFIGVMKLLNMKSTFGFNTSSECNVDVQSDPNYTTTPQIRSECKIFIGGTDLCSGTFLANTSSDSTMFFLTAGHCISSQSQASSTIFIYNYESPHGLHAVDGAIDLQTLGATFVAGSTEADFALLKLAGERPSALYRTYFSGWNRSSTPPAPFFAIHHARGDVKKISTCSASLSAATFNSPPFYNNYHWRVPLWDTGTTEQGSSGCGIFDNGGALVGTLSGGSAVCGNSVDDYFVRFNAIWDASPLANKQLAIWLDSANSSVSDVPLLGKELYAKQNAQRVSNISQMDSATLLTSSPVRYRCGVYSTSPNTKVAERFLLTTQKKIEGVYLDLGKGSTSSNHSVTLSFWSGVNAPEVLLYSMTNIPISTLGSNKEKFIKLDKNFVVGSGDLFVSYQINSVAVGDTVSCYYSRIHKDGSIRNTNSLFLFDGSLWHSYSSIYPSENGSLWLDLVTTDIVNSSLLNPVKSTIDVNVYPNPATESVNIVVDNEGFVITNINLVSLDGVQYTLDFSALSKNGVSCLLPAGLKGLFLLQISVNDDVVLKKILIE